jgi:hypothetical protein
VEAIILGRRFSMAPILGQVNETRFAGWRPQRKDATKGMSEGVFKVTPEMEIAHAPLPREDESTPSRVEGAAPSGPTNTYTTTDPLAKERKTVNIPAAPPGTSNVTRALGSEKPGKAQHTRRGLTDEEKAQIDAMVKEHIAKTGARHFNPLIAALKIDKPAHEIAHYIETNHPVYTVPHHPGAVVTPESSAAEAGAPEATEGHDYNAWMADYERRLRQEADPKGFAQAEQEAGLADAARQSQLRAHAAKLAGYVQGGALTQKQAAAAQAVAARLPGS